VTAPSDSSGSAHRAGADAAPLERWTRIYARFNEALSGIVTVNGQHHRIARRQRTSARMSSRPAPGAFARCAAVVYVCLVDGSPAMSVLGGVRVAAAALLGVAAGLAVYTFVYARGASYLTNDPRACLNCHVMNEQFAGWVKSSHHAVAACNDCHTPPEHVAKYLTKAENGFRHSLAFTTGWFPEPIQITTRNREVTERACRHCHAAIVQAIDRFPDPGRRLRCIECHRSVGHLH
jgi:cytochrome c nitrite reductase small subunit